MLTYHPSRSARPNLLVILVLSFWAFGSQEGEAKFESDDPVIAGMVNRGIAYLEKNYKGPMHYDFKGIASAGYGEHALMGYAHMKVEHNPSNPVVQQGLRAARAIVSLLRSPDPGGMTSKSIYNASVAALLLAEVDRLQYKDELRAIASFLTSRQHRSGAFVYFADDRGDTSQTQYAILALWTIDRAGLTIDYSRVPRIVNWLLRVQDPSGGWPYMGEDPGGAGRRIKQKKVTASMALAGGSTMLIAGDILKMWGDTNSENDPNIFGLPKAVKLEIEGLENANVRRPQVPTDPMFSAIKDCDGYLRSNPANPGVLKSQFPYYQLYSLERYESFKEIALDQKGDPKPKWFRDGINYLKGQEDAGGGWSKDTYSLMAGTTSTCLSILFLIRSTKKAIEQASSGALAGGQGLPSDTTQIKVEGTKIKGKAVAGAVTDLLDILEGDEVDSLEGKSIPEDLALAEDPKDRKAQLDRMERLVRGSQSWQARRVASRLLGQSDEMRVVPTLIFALSDPDSMVKLYARDGLRFISRKFEGYEMPDKPTDSDVNNAQLAWRAWYRTMDPGYIFIDYDL